METDISLVLFAGIAFGTFLIAGTIKGAVGIGLPTAALAILTLFIAPREAMATLMFPMLFSNVLQVYRAGDTKRAFIQYAPFSAALACVIVITLILARQVSSSFLLAMIGLMILSFVATSLIRVVPKISDQNDLNFQIILGGIAGVLGGLTAVWAPPMVMYLAARDTPKDEFVRATGILITLGTIPLCIGFFQLGYFTGPLAGISLAMVIPAFLGFFIGEKIRSRLSQERFRRYLMTVFFLIGISLIWRALS